MNENLIKEKSGNYFSEKKYLERSNPKSHIDLSKEIDDKFNIKTHIDSDRDYGHSKNFLMILNPEFGILSGDYDYLIDSEKVMLEKTNHNKHWSVYFKLSHIDNIACYILNSRSIIDNDIDVEECPEDDFPEEITQQLHAILDVFYKQKWSVTNFNQLEKEKRDWLDSTFHFKGYQPSLADILFGSFEFYSAAGI
ncbi:hypothetical protein [Fluviicola sp.]|uniref:hypothetical protein n=1 Tax=Fluviicola sp. TaxID=1917219 RepID=UPI002604C252|nr:hypothetical protein [Fluviicola sp.]